MKKITFLFMFLTTSVVFGQQVVIQNFETPSSFAFAGFEGLGGASIQPDPAAGGSRLDGLRLLSVTTGNPWQGAEIIQATNSAKLTTDKTMSIDVYATQAFTLLAKVESGTGPNSAASQSYTVPNTWQTLTFTFTQALDNTAVANGIYSKIVFFPNWKSTNDGFNPPANFTIHLDNITSESGTVTPPNDPTPATAAPLPTVANSNVYSIYNDTNSYTTVFPAVYAFGNLSGEPDLDPSTTVVNKAYKFNFGVAGWGQGEASGALANVTPYNFVSFDYWAQAGLPNGFRFVMISNATGVTEHVYQIGTNEALVTGQWKRVEIPMSYFTGLGFSTTNFFQWKVSPFEDSINNAGFVYVDNILLTVNSVLSNENFELSSFNAYPNPTQNVWNITSKQNITSVVLFDVMGKKVQEVKPNATNLELNAAELANGIYFATVTSELGSKVIKLVKN